MSTDPDTAHKEKMIRRDDAFEARKAQATREKGLIIVNTGAGKGKTTASLGIAFTREQKFVQANPALEQMLGWERGTLTGQSGRAVWGSDAEYAEIGALIGPQLASGAPVELVRELRGETARAVSRCDS